MAASDTAGFWSVAEQWPDKIAIIDHDGTAHTFGQVRDRVNQISNLFTSAGLRSGDHVAYMLSNGVEVFAVSLALLQIGVYYTPMNYHLTPDEIAYVLRDSGAQLFIGDATFAERSESAADRAELSSSGRFSLGAVPTFVDIRRAARSQSVAAPPERTPGATLIYTSGTTGSPKGILRAWPRTFEDAAAAAEKGAQKYGWTSDVTYLVQGPLYHSGVLSHPTNILHIGGTVVIMADRWRPEDALALIEQHRIFATHMVPTMFHRLLALPAEVRRRFDLSSLGRNASVQSAAVCPVETKRAMLDWWGPVFQEVYGGTEGSMTKITSEEWVQHPGSVGRAGPGVTLRVLDENNEEVAAGDVGVIYGRLAGSDGFGAEYFNAPEKTASSRVGGFQTLGDMGFVDEDGWLYIVDRRVDLIVSGGVNIYPAEIEAALIQHPDVVDVAVIGVPDSEWGHVVAAVVELADWRRAGSRDRSRAPTIRAVATGRVQVSALDRLSPRAAEAFIGQASPTGAPR